MEAPAPGRIALMTPSFAPDLRDVAAMMAADMILLDDTMAWSRKSRLTRARIRMGDTIGWLHIGIHPEDRGRCVQDMRTDPDPRWIDQAARTLETFYRGSRYYEEYGPWLLDILGASQQGPAKPPDAAAAATATADAAATAATATADAAATAAPATADAAATATSTIIIPDPPTRSSDGVRLLPLLLDLRTFILDALHLDGLIARQRLLSGTDSHRADLNTPHMPEEPGRITAEEGLDDGTHPAKAGSASAILMEDASHTYMRPHPRVVHLPFAHPTYRQHAGGFLPGCSLLDLLFEEGPESWRILDAIEAQARLQASRDLG